MPLGLPDTRPSLALKLYNPELFASIRLGHDCAGVKSVCRWKHVDRAGSYWTVSAGFCFMLEPSRGGRAALPSRPRQQNTCDECDEHEGDGAVGHRGLAAPGERYRLRAGSHGDANQPDDANEYQHG